MGNDQNNTDRVIPVIEEELITGKQVTKTGSIRVEKHVDRRVENVALPLMHETADVRRVSVGRVVESRPEMRTEGDTTIIPVVEEELVVTKRLVLKEEIYITRRRSRTESVQEVTLENERAEIVRLDSSGRVTGSADPAKSRRKLEIRRRSDSLTE